MMTLGLGLVGGLLVGGLPVMGGANPSPPGVIQGQIFPPAVRDARLSVWLWDGFSLQPVSVTPEGTFEVSSQATDGTWQVLLVAHPGWRPVARAVPGGPRGWKGEVILEPLEDAFHQGVVGVVYLAAAGGRLRPIRGIYRLYPQEPVILQGGGGQWTTHTDPNGFFWFSVPPGTYRIFREGDPRSREVVVPPGEIRVVPLPAGRMRID